MCVITSWKSFDEFMELRLKEYAFSSELMESLRMLIKKLTASLSRKDMDEVVFHIQKTMALAQGDITEFILDCCSEYYTDDCEIGG